MITKIALIFESAKLYVTNKRIISFKPVDLGIINGYVIIFVYLCMAEAVSCPFIRPLFPEIYLVIF